MAMNLTLIKLKTNRTTKKQEILPPLLFLTKPNKLYIVHENKTKIRLLYPVRILTFKTKKQGGIMNVFIVYSNNNVYLFFFVQTLDEIILRGYSFGNVG